MERLSTPWGCWGGVQLQHMMLWGKQPGSQAPSFGGAGKAAALTPVKHRSLFV